MKIRDLEEFSGYAITDDGRVYSHKTGRWLKQHLSRGYPMVNLTLGNLPRRKGTGRNAKQQVVRVHRLIHLAFFTGQKGVINHKNGIKTDNRLDNLEVTTSAANNKHAYDSGLRKPRTLTREQAIAMNNAKRRIRELVV